MSVSARPIDEAFQLCLIVTEACNLNCSYCYCDTKLPATMPFETARRALDRAVEEHHARTNGLHVLLMGGEPFMAFGLIRQLVEYTGSAYPGVAVLFKTVTNGTLVHGELQEWLTRHRHHFHTELSLDGDEQSHNLNRNNSFGRIDLPFFLENTENPTVSTVIVPENLASVSANVRFLSEKGFRVKAALADGVDWSDPVLAETWALQLKDLGDYYLANPEIHPFNLLSLATHTAGGSYPSRRCRPGINTTAVDAAGSTHACHRSSRLYNNGSWQIPAEAAALNAATSLDDACSRCCVNGACNACPASTASLRNDRQQSEARCRLYKVMFLANAWFHLRMLSLCPGHVFLRKRSAGQKKAMLAGSQLILDQLNPGIPF